MQRDLLFNHLFKKQQACCNNMQNKMKNKFIKRISTGIIYQVFEIDGSVIRVYSNITGEYVGQAFLRSEVEFLPTEEDLKNECELNALENQSYEG